MTMATASTMDTRTGGKLDLEDPSGTVIELEDVACALSRICRFAGHSSQFYSVAQHAVLVSGIVNSIGRSDLRFLALHHDSHEAYIGDISSPLKRLLAERNELETLRGITNSLDVAIRSRFGIPDPSDEDACTVKYADLVALAVEAKTFMSSRFEIPEAVRFEPLVSDICIRVALDPMEAEAEFIAEHRRIEQES
ncbi:metal-dependent phosphohydrolase [Candidatus Saccharibacteria bacterium]|nr:MAG: metal-dependent phosphohydrolase [Candidatus Saccharibacteria bacterium]